MYSLVVCVCVCEWYSETGLIHVNKTKGGEDKEREREWGEGSTVNTFTNWPRDSHKQSCRVDRQRKRERKKESGMMSPLLWLCN